MENYLRLLNPKTTNFDALPGAGHNVLTAADVCIAMSYAKLTPVQSELIRLKALNQNTFDDIEKALTVLRPYFDKYIFEKINQLCCDSFDKAVVLSLIEHCRVPAGYKPSVRSRAAILGVSASEIQRKIKGLTDNLNELIQQEMETGLIKISNQLKK
ncbi:hypothetical protein [Acinetobacter radioresistens]|uniref:hypothetical protein n=1 Tax=Acinetobacter radioresistens TaxID=40216 RepID=UPI00094682C9|nr:hypothetical protein [Acinetobacter radioresistens]